MFDSMLRIRSACGILQQRELVAGAAHFVAQFGRIQPRDHGTAFGGRHEDDGQQGEQHDQDDQAGGDRRGQAVSPAAPLQHAQVQRVEDHHQQHGQEQRQQGTAT